MENLCGEMGLGLGLGVLLVTWIHSYILVCLHQEDIDYDGLTSWTKGEGGTISGGVVNIFLKYTSLVKACS